MALSATASAMCVEPPTTSPGGNPVTADPGLSPTSPVITEGPVLVMVLPASTANEVAVPSPTAGCAAYAAGPRATTARTITMPLTNRVAPVDASARLVRW